MLSRGPERREGAAKNLNARQREMLRLRLSMTGAGGVSRPNERHATAPWASSREIPHKIKVIFPLTPTS